jgi:hypothetical protein
VEVWGGSAFGWHRPDEWPVPPCTGLVPIQHGHLFWQPPGGVIVTQEYHAAQQRGGATAVVAIRSCVRVLVKRSGRRSHCRGQ